MWWQICEIFNWNREDIHIRNKVKILLDISIQTTKTSENNKSDSILLDKEEKAYQIEERRTNISVSKIIEDLGFCTKNNGKLIQILSRDLEIDLFKNIWDYHRIYFERYWLQPVGEKKKQSIYLPIFSNLKSNFHQYLPPFGVNNN